MKTLTQVQTAGMAVHTKVRLEHGGPYGNERSIPLQAAGAAPGERYIKGNLTQLHSAVPADRREAAQAAMAQGDVVLLTRDDFPEEPRIIRFETKDGEMRRGGPGGYPYRDKVYRDVDSQSLTDFARQMTGVPSATWAIRPQTGSWPDAPELLLFTPVASSSGQVSEADANALVFGKLGDVKKPPTPAGESVRVEDDAVYIGKIRLDRRHGYFIVLPETAAGAR